MQIHIKIVKSLWTRRNDGVNQLPVLALLTESGEGTGYKITAVKVQDHFISLPDK